MLAFKKSVIANMIVSIVFVFVGIMITFKPDTTVSLIINLIGSVFIVYGIINLISYLKNSKKSSGFQVELLCGIIGVLLGIVIMVFGKTVLSIFRVILGIWIIYTAIVNFQVVVMLKNSCIKSWRSSLALSLIIFGCGVYITFKSNAVISIIGIIILIYSTIALIENCIAYKNLKNIYVQ